MKTPTKCRNPFNTLLLKPLELKLVGYLLPNQFLKLVEKSMSLFASGTSIDAFGVNNCPILALKVSKEAY